MFLSTRCPGCGTPGAVPCESCVATMGPAGPVPLPAGLDGCSALLTYEGPGRELVAQLKYRNARAVLGWLAGGMVGLVPGSGIHVVTWAPTTAARRRRRGFDQAELLARRVAHGAGLSCRSTLTRRPGPPQTGRSLGERRNGPRFEVRRPVAGLGVVVVDDVVTTGATLAAAGRALRAAGAARVVGLAAAHPP